MKKLVYWSVIVALLLSSMAVCGPTSTLAAEESILDFLAKAAEPYKGTTIRFITETTPPSDALAGFLHEFEEATGIEVVIERYGHPELEERATLDFASQTGIYDVYNIDTADVGRIVESGYVLPLQPFMDNPDLTPADFSMDGFLQKALEGCGMWGGEVYGIPFDLVIEFWAYRGDLFDEYGLSVPQSWDELTEVAKTLTLDRDDDGETDLYGVGMMAKKFVSVNWDYFFYLWGAGGQLYDENYVPQVNTPEGIEALEFWHSLKEYAPPGVTTWDYNEVRDAFAQDLIATAIEWDDQLEQVEDPDKSQVVGLLRYDSFPGKTADTPRVAHFGGSSLMIPSSSKNPEAAWLFILWATSPALQSKAAPFGYHPTLEAFYTQPDLAEKYPEARVRMLDVEYRAAQVMHFRPQIPEWSPIKEAMMDELSKFMADQQSAEDTAANIQKAMEEILAERIEG